MITTQLPIVLSIAGTDPSGGAGIQADIKAISATGSYAASVITALVAQNTQGVQAIADVDPSFITQQLESVFNDLIIHTVKIGMLHREKVIDEIASFFEKKERMTIILDPVMVAKNGSLLLPLDKIEFLKKRLFPLVHLITPNLFEAEMIVGKKIKTQAEMISFSEGIGESFNINVLLKGGHFESDDSSDVLYLKDTKEHHWFHEKRIKTNNTHGTGCTLSSAIASYLAQKYSLKDAIKLAKQYVTNAIDYGKTLHIGKGNGPLHHFYCKKIIEFNTE